MSKILLVDDDRQLLSVVGKRLQALGFECRAETNGAEALAYVEANPVDLAVLDIMIPGMSGFEVCRRIRQNPNRFGTQIMFLSSMNSEEEIEHGLAQGADDYLGKPFHVDDLVRRIERLLAVSRTQSLTDEVTSLPGSKCIKLEIQKRIYQGKPFDLVYAQLLRLNDLTPLGAGLRDRAVRHFARALQKCAEKTGGEGFCAGHMGGGHFVCLLEPGLSKGFSQAVAKFWDAYQPNFYSGAGLEKAFELAKERPGAAGGVPIMETLLCVTSHDPRVHESAQGLLEILSHIRENALEQSRKGVIIDRRAAPVEA